jgi:alkylation response protein AidB-like acyl-CoA dehydrogenase
MKQFPTDRQEKRQMLLDAVESVKDVVAAHANESDAMGTLAPAAVEALAGSGLWRLKLPAELGGAEADPVTQIEVIETMTYHDTSAGWAVMIGATSIGWPGAFLPQAGIDVVFKDGRVPTCAGIGGATGRAEPVEGGYVLTGRFAFASGIRHAEWLIAGAPVTRDGEPAEIRTFVLPAKDAIIHLDSWDVVGLKGSGSNDFSTDNLFVPESMCWDRGIMARGEPERGGPIFRLGMPGFTANEHVGFSLGAGRRALDLVIDLAKAKRRGHGALASAVADRAVFQRFVAESDLRLRAARSLALEIFEDAWQTVCAGSMPDARQQAQMRAVSVYATDVACDVATQAMRFAGGSALQQSGQLQRFWRDVIGGGQHFAVSDAGYEAYGQNLLGVQAPELSTGILR